MRTTILVVHEHYMQFKKTNGGPSQRHGRQNIFAI